VSAAENVVWHDAECGGYADDLGVWEALADRAAGEVLDLGCGTGRVALHLAERGAGVVGVDSDPAVLRAMLERARARNLAVSGVCADVRALALGREFGLCVAPMQLLQLMGGSPGRRSLLGRARMHLAKGARLAAAIVEGVPPSALAPAGDALPDVREVAGIVHSSRPLGASLEGGTLAVRRLRQTVAPDGDLREAIHVDRLDVIDTGTVVAEAADCGLELSDRVEVPAGEAHVGSTVLVWEAA
jgi:SAM-dependent methyltransferase